MPPSPGRNKKKRKQQDAAQGLDDDAICWGAMEVVVVYLGASATKQQQKEDHNEKKDTDNDKNNSKQQEDDEEEEYAFVRLADDVLYCDITDDSQDEIGVVEWFAPDEEEKDIYWPEEPEEEEVTATAVPIGSIVCVTQVVERLDGSIQVPDAVREHVRKKLAQQLSDDYDPATMQDNDNDEPSFQARVQKRKKQRKRLTNMAAGPAAKKRRQHDESDNDDDDDHHDGKLSASKKRKRTANGKAKGGAGTSKSRLKPRPQVKLEKDIWMRKSNKAGNFNGDTYRASKEVIRAVRTGSTHLLKKLIEDQRNVADVYVQQSVSVSLNAVDYAFAKQDKVALELLFAANSNNNKRTDFPECCLVEQTSGQHTSRYANYNRYQVAASRGGKEGNNAFIKDTREKLEFPLGDAEEPTAEFLGHLFTRHDPVRVEFLNFAFAKFHQNQLFQWGFPLHALLKSGNRELTEFAMREMVKKGGAGLNQLHADVLGTYKSTVLEKTRAVSVVKKCSADSGGAVDTGARFCPVHCAATNPDPSYIKQLLVISPEAVSCLDSHEAGLLHYAAVSEGPDTLQWLLDSFPSLSREAKTRRPKEIPLMWAARSARANNVRVLCKNLSQEDLSRQFAALNAEGLTVLHIAVSSFRSDRYDTVRALFAAAGGSADADTLGDTRLTDKVTPAAIATRCGDLEMLQLLVEHGADLAQTDKLDRSLAVWAAMNGQVHVLSYLLREGVDVELADSSGNTPLHYAAAYGWIECEQLLLAYADPVPRNSWSSTPLSLSLKKGSFACAAALLKLKDKVNVNVCDKTGRSLFSSLVGTYLSQLSSNKDAPLPWAIQQMLDRDDLDLCLADSQNRTVLHFIAASPSSHLPVVQDLVSQLLPRGLDPLKVDDMGDVAASLALRHGNLEFARPLLNHVSHSDVQLSRGTSLLHLLIHQLCRCSDVKLFLHIYDTLKGTWEDVVDDQGRTPLLLAADLLRGAECQRADNPNWCRVKEAFEALVERMPSHIPDTLQRKAEFSDWKKVEKRIQDADGLVNWTRKDEYSTESLECCSLFHGLCLSLDVKWALKLCRKLMKQVKNKAHLSMLLNLKLIECKSPVLIVVDKFNALPGPKEKDHGQQHQEVNEEEGLVGLFDDESSNDEDDNDDDDASTNPREIDRKSLPAVAGQDEPALELLSLLRENGADMNGVPHPAFHSLAEALDLDVDMEVVQPEISHGSDEEKLESIYDFVLHRERVRVKEKLFKKESHREYKETLRPHLRYVTQTGASIRLLKNLLPHSDADCRDLNGDTVLHIAVGKGMASWTTAILEHADVNAVNTKGDSALTIAAKAGGLDLLKILLAAGAKLGHCSPIIGTALHAAVLGGHSGLVEFLLTKATVHDVNALDAQKRTPLHCAIAVAAVSSKQEIKPVEDQLIAAGSEINAKDVYGRTSLSYAFVELNTDMNCGFPAQVTKRDPIELLSKLCSLDSIRLDITDAQKRTSLHLAAAAGASVCVLSLTESNKELMNAVDMDENTPLAVALLAKRWDTALLLIGKGSSLDIDVTHIERAWKNGVLVEKSRSKRPALWHALRSRGALSTYMLSADRLPLGTVLSTLLVTGSFQKALLQIQQCRDNKLICVTNKGGINALHRLAQAPSFSEAPGFDVALADALIDAGIRVRDTCTRGRTVLHAAAFHGHINLTTHLLSRGAVVDVRDREGGTPLSSLFAGTCRTAEMVRALLNASKDAAAMANSVVKGTRDQNEDEKLRSLADPETRLFDTPKQNCRSKEALMKVLAEEAVQTKISSGSTKALPHSERTVSSTPLIEAVRHNDLRTVNALLSYGADPSKRDEDNRTGFHYAAMDPSTDMLSLLLRYSVESIDACDRYGFSPLTYTVLRMLQKQGSSTLGLDILLDYGADPQAGGALHIAVRSNQMDMVLPMLQCVKSTLKTAAKQKKKGTISFKKGDVVWARFGGIRGSWQVATIVNAENQVVSVVPGRVKAVNDPSGHRFTATECVHQSWICAIDHERDVPVPSHDELVKHFQDSSAKSEVERMELLKQRTGAEQTLLGEMDKSHPSVHCVLSAELKSGDLVGKFVNTLSLLQIGVVVAAHPNGLYDVQLLRGRLYKEVKRTQLRTLRKELRLQLLEDQQKPLDPTVLCACVRPFRFGSYENMDMLRALANTKVTLDGKDNNGRTALDLARPDSEMQAFLRDATKAEGGRRKHVEPVASRQGPPPLDGIDLDKDADAAMRALHDEGADATELIVPDVSDVCQLESDGICVVQDQEADDYYDVSLTKVKVQHGRYGLYEFYKMQVVHDPVQQLYVLLTNWGRIGESGKHQQTPFSSKEACVKEFAKVFRSKTGNIWADRKELFEKKPGKYSFVDRKRTRVKNPEKLLRAVVEELSHPCSLEPSVAEMLRALLDVGLLQSALGNSGLDQSQLPLGQLSLDTIDKAEQKLREIKLKLDELGGDTASDTNKVRSKLEEVTKLTNEYYELLPAGGDQVVKPFSCNNEYRFKQAVELIRVLRDLNVTKQLLLGAMHMQKEFNPIEYCYRALQMLIELGSKERESVQQYIDNTCSDDVIVSQIYRLENGEDVQEDISNKRLLFHGSKNAHVLGILKQGLRIAPPEAPTTGFMYGKGVYFADQFSKAFGYTSGVSSNGKKLPRAFVFVAEVAVGTPHVALEAEYMEAPRPGSHSTFAPAPIVPDPALDVTLDTGATVPLGPLVESNILPQQQIEWREASHRYWHYDISAEDSHEIERIRNDPNTKFPARVHIQINRHVDYVVLLENGPFSDMATAMPAVKEKKKATEQDQEDLSNQFLGNSDKNNNDFKVLTLKRHSQHRSGRGGGRQHSEFIVYDTKQIRLKYLIELTSPASIKRQFQQQQDQKSQTS